MNHVQKSTSKAREFFHVFVFAVGFAGVFFIGVSHYGFVAKLIAAFSVLTICAGIAFWLLRTRSNGIESLEDRPKASLFDKDIDEELAVLEEAAVFFSASLRSTEMFKLLAARLRALIAECRIEFYVVDSLGNLSPVIDVSADTVKEKFPEFTDLAYRANSSRKISRGKELVRKSDSDTRNYLTIAVPLFRGEEVFCVLGVYTAEGNELPDDSILEAIAQRVTPLISGSLSFESSVKNALTDSLTRLPNERAMYLVLENQVAESQRFGKARPLSLLAIDIESFDEINQRFGHAEGDRVLEFSGHLLRDELRKMDFLARTSDDEFFIVLPTADAGSAEQIENRIREAFEADPFKRPDGTQITIKLSFGCAVFGEDADSASGLIRAAVERKQIGKPMSAGSVLKFPTFKNR